MAIIDPPTFVPCVDEDDPDDYRPDSRWAAAIDPTAPDGVYVKEAAVVIDDVAPGDRVPLHTHTTYEVVLVEGGRAEVTLGDETRMVAPGTIVFIPPGVAHGGSAFAERVRFVGFFPTSAVDISYLERNPAPGTEGDPPQSVQVFHLRPDK